MLKMEIELGQLAIHLERFPPHIVHKNKLSIYFKNLSIYLKKTSGKRRATITKLKRQITDWRKMTSTYAVEDLLAST